MDTFVFFILFALHCTCSAETIRVSGSTLAAPIMDFLTFVHSAGRDTTFTYDAVGSGTGKGNLIAQTHDLAVSDSFLKEEEEGAMGGLHLVPIVATAVTVAYNVPGLEDILTVSNSCMVSIFNGQTTHWNGDCIQSSNTDLVLPDEPIILVVREDKSGTTEVFTRALNKFDPEGFPEVSSLPEWTACETVTCWRAQGNAGSSQVAAAIPYSVTYTALPYLGSIDHVKMLGSDGVARQATIEGVQVAIDAKGNDILEDPETDFIAVDVPGAWPMATFSFFVVPNVSWPRCSVALKAILFIMFGLEDTVAADAMRLNGYAPIPSSIAKVLSDRLSKLSCGGERIFDSIAPHEVAIMVIAGMTGFSNVVIIYAIFRKRFHALYTMAPTTGLYIRVASNIFATVAVYMWTGYPKQGQCTAIPWVTVASVGAVFSNLYYALNGFVDSRHFYGFYVPNLVTPRFLQLLCFLMATFSVLLFVIWQATDPLSEVRRTCVSDSGANFVSAVVLYTLMAQLVTLLSNYRAKPQAKKMTFKRFVMLESYVETFAVYGIFIPAQYALSTAIVYNPDEPLRLVLAPNVALLADSVLTTAFVITPIVVATFQTNSSEIRSLFKVNENYCEELRLSYQHHSKNKLMRGGSAASVSYQLQASLPTVAEKGTDDLTFDQTDHTVSESASEVLEQRHPDVVQA